MGINNNKSILLSSEEFSEIEAMVKNLINKKFLPNKYLQTLKGLEKSISNLEQTNLSLKLLADSTLDVLFRISSSGKILYLSSSCEELIGYKPEEMIGNSFSKYSR